MAVQDMEVSDASVTNGNAHTSSTTTSSPQSVSPTSSSSPPPPLPPPTPVIISPCAACKILRRRCAVEKCVLAPYFPPTEPAKFTIAHRVFGASNIIKLLQDLPESQRADAVSSMVYEAGARIRDPVYGCAGAICQLQKQVSELQGQLAKAQAEILTMQHQQHQQTNLVALLCMEMAQSASQPPAQQFVDNLIDTSPTIYQNNNNNNISPFLDETNVMGSMWEPLWT